MTEEWGGGSVRRRWAGWVGLLVVSMAFGAGLDDRLT